MQQPAGVVLAGGLGSRMGHVDKALLLLAGRPLLAHVLGRLEPQVAEVAISANGDPSRFAAWRLPVLADAPQPGGRVDPGNGEGRDTGPAAGADGRPGRNGGATDALRGSLANSLAGPLAGVLAGLDWAARTGAGAVVTAAVDTPFLPCDLVPRLLLAGDGGAALARTETGPHPTFALWPVSLAQPLREYLAAGGRRMLGFMQDHGFVEAQFPEHPFDPFRNLNHPADLAGAEALFAAGKAAETALGP